MIKYIILLFSTLTYAQITSASISGRVTDGDKPIANLEITITHLPTNYFYKTETNKKGEFSLDDLDVGGPYKIVIKADYIEERILNNIYLRLGENDLPKDIIVNKR